MEILSKVLFYGVIPAIIVYFRVKKKYRTAFAIGMVATSLLLGLIVSRTFMPTPVERFTEFVNENRYNDAKQQLQFIVQKNPEDIKKIDMVRIVNPVMFDRIKQELSRYYLSIANDIAEKGDYKGTFQCGDEAVLKGELDSIEHGMRITEMAESLGGDGKFIREKFSNVLGHLNAARENLKKSCSGK